MFLFLMINLTSYDADQSLKFTLPKEASLSTLK
jgi:hypothetical protein